MRKKTVRVELDSANRISGTLANDAIFNVDWDSLFGFGEVDRFQVRADVLVAPNNYRYANDGSFHKGTAWVTCQFPAVLQGSFRANGATYNILTHIQHNIQDANEQFSQLSPLSYVYDDSGLVLQEYRGRPSGNLRVAFWRFAGNLTPTLMPLRLTNVSAELADMGRWYISLKLDIFYVEDGLPRELLLEPRVIHSRLDLMSGDATADIGSANNNVRFSSVPWGALIPVGARRVRCAFDFSTEQFQFADFGTFFRSNVEVDIGLPTGTGFSVIDTTGPSQRQRVTLIANRCVQGATPSEGPTRRWCIKYGSPTNLVELRSVPTGGPIDVLISAVTIGAVQGSEDYASGVRAASSTLNYAKMLCWWISIHFFSEVP